MADEDILGAGLESGKFQLAGVLHTNTCLFLQLVPFLLGGYSVA